jgi:hypothetical protein
MIHESTSSSSPGPPVEPNVVSKVFQMSAESKRKLSFSTINFLIPHREPVFAQDFAKLIA